MFPFIPNRLTPEEAFASNRETYRVLQEQGPKAFYEVRQTYIERVLAGAICAETPEELSTLGQRFLQCDPSKHEADHAKVLEEVGGARLGLYKFRSDSKEAPRFGAFVVEDVAQVEQHFGEDSARLLDFYGRLLTAPTTMVYPEERDLGEELLSAAQAIRQR